MLPKNKFPYIVGLVFTALVLFLVLVLPGQLAQRRANRFAEPFFSHSLPESARHIQSVASENDDGSTSATIILQTSWTQDEIDRFYNDTVYPPARENDQVTLSVLPLDAGSLEALQKAGVYQEEGGSYWFVYLYSAPAA